MSKDFLTDKKRILQAIPICFSSTYAENIISKVILITRLAAVFRQSSAIALTGFTLMPLNE